MINSLNANGAEACKLTPCRETPLRAASGRSQASAPLFRQRLIGSVASTGPASELAGGAVPQGCLPAKPAGPAGGHVASVWVVLKRALRPPPSFLDTFGITRRRGVGCARRLT